MADNLDIRDLLLEAQAEFAEVVTEVMQELAMPLMMQALKMKWTTMPDEMKEMLKQAQPDMYKRMMEMVSA